MSKLNILVAEDEKPWQDLLKETLEGLGDEVDVEIVSDYASALREIKNAKYDLATVDLSLPGTPPISSENDLLGMELMREWRTSNQNQACGLIVLTAHSTTTRTREALRTYGAFDFIDKVDFDNHKFPQIARGAILDARFKQASGRANSLYKFTINFRRENLDGCVGIQQGEYQADSPQQFNVADLARRADNLNWMILKGGPELWRREAKSIGDNIYQSITNDKRISQELGRAQAIPARSKDLWLEFSGPSSGLGIPFELLRDDNNYLCLEHVLTRRIAQRFHTKKTDTFNRFIQKLLDEKKKLRILIVGSNSDGRIPEAEAEAKDVRRNLELDLQTLGIPFEISALIGGDATYDIVKDALQSGGYHLFHYAGHGRFTDELPEISGLILLDNSGIRVMSASDLNIFVRNSDLQFIFLSCCLGARSAEQEGRGDFFGIFDALAKANVPTVLGYRWTVSDNPARLLAKSFYRSLWRTFSPAESLLEARREATTGEAGRDDETWLSPVLLVQNR